MPKNVEGATFRNQIVLFEVREQTLAILHSRPAGEQIHEVSIQLPKHHHMAQHLAKCINLASQASFRQFAGEFWRPLN